MASEAAQGSASLLLLPSITLPATPASIQEAYGEILAYTLNRMWRGNPSASEPAVLDIVVPCSCLWQSEASCRSFLYPLVQPLVAGVYKLLATTASRDCIELDSPSGIDARILLLSYSGDDDGPQDQILIQSGFEHFGPVVYGRTLIASNRVWKEVFLIEEPNKSKICRELTISRPNIPIHHLRAQSHLSHIKGGVSVSKSERRSSRNHHIAVGGTFDHLHVGHKLLLTMTAFVMDFPEPSRGSLSNPAQGAPSSSRQSLTVGITGDQLLQNKKYAELLECWSDRQRSVQKFLEAIIDFRPPQSRLMKIEESSDPGPNGHAVKSWLGDLLIECVEIWDPFGPTITDPKLSALVLSGETRSGGQSVNQKRHGQGWSPMEIFEVDVLDAQEQNKTEDGEDNWKDKISSTAIRKGHWEKLRDKGRI